MKTAYKTVGTCSSEILVEEENGIITNVRFFGGCNGNLQGISKLVVGRKIEEVIERLNGTRCGNKPTSCPDQLCRALEQLVREKNESAQA
jgi:uncharacterized protein (TIGR03905 family)